MKELIQFLVALILGAFITLAILSKYPQKTFKSKKKLTPDYELTITDGTVVDTVWVYKICL